MSTNTLEPSLEFSKERLKNFWGSLSRELQEKVGLNITFLMNWSAFRLDPLNLLQEEITKAGDHTEVNQIINEIRLLDKKDQDELVSELINYFLSRNSIKTPE